MAGRAIADAVNVAFRNGTLIVDSRGYYKQVFDIGGKAYPHGSGATRIRILVMPGLVPGIHAFVAPAFAVSTWMAGSSPAMTTTC
jgi:hypothetical protein